MTKTPLAIFIEQEMKRLDLNKSEFGRALGVSHVTIGRIINGKTKTPDLDLLVDLSKLTQTDIASIVHLVRPDAFRGAPGLGVIAARFERLPEDERDFVEAVLSGLATKRKDKRGDGSK